MTPSRLTSFSKHSLSQGSSSLEDDDERFVYSGLASGQDHTRGLNSERQQNGAASGNSFKDSLDSKSNNPKIIAPFEQSQTIEISKIEEIKEEKSKENSNRKISLKSGSKEIIVTEMEFSSHHKQRTEEWKAPTRNILQSRNPGEIGSDRYCPRLDSEKSLFTQESCSAPENDSSEAQSERIISSLPRIINLSPEIHKNTNIPPFSASKEDHKMPLYFESHDNVAMKQNDETKEHAQINEQSLGSFNMVNQESPQNDQFIFASFQEIRNPKTLILQEVDHQNQQLIPSQQVSNTASVQNSQQNLQSNDFNYSPDFRDSESLPRLEQQSDTFSPAIFMNRNKSVEKPQYQLSNFQKNNSSQRPNSQNLVAMSSNNNDEGKSDQFLKLEDGETSNVLLRKQQQIMLKYEEFEGDCYTTSSHNNNNNEFGQVFFSGGTQLIGSGFQGGSFDLNHLSNERMSDRIYERVDHAATVGSQSKEEDPFSFYKHCEDDSSPSQQNNSQMFQGPQSPLYGERKIPTLSIITEEETQHDHSQIHRGLSGAGDYIDRQHSNDVFLLKINQSHDETSGEPQYNKSKSQPMTKRDGQSRSHNRISPMNGGNKNGGAGASTGSADVPVRNNSAITIGASPNGDNLHNGVLYDNNISHRNNHSSISEYLLQNNNNMQLQNRTPFHQSLSHLTEDNNEDMISKRLSYDLKQQQMQEDGNFLRLHSHEALRSSANNIGGFIGVGGTQDYALISEEDLLSNIDRQSRMMMPQNDFVSDEENKLDPSNMGNQLTPNYSHKTGGTIQILDEGALIQKIKEQARIIEQLRSENQDQVKTIQVQDDQLNDLMDKNVQLQKEIQRMQTAPNKMPSEHQNSAMNEETFLVKTKVDEEIQVNLKRDSAKKNSANKRRFSSQIKQTPKRSVLQDYSTQQDHYHEMSKSSLAKEYETPSLRKNFTSVQDSMQSPLNTLSITIPRLQYQQMMEEISGLQAQLQALLKLKQNLERQSMTNESDIIKSTQQQAELIGKMKELVSQLEVQQKHITEKEQKCKVLETQIEGLKTEAIENRQKLQVATSEIEMLKSQYGEAREQIERTTSVTSLLPIITEQEIQTDPQQLPPMLQSISRQIRSPSQYSMSTAKKEATLPHTIPLPEFNSTQGMGDFIQEANTSYGQPGFLNNNHFSTYSSKAGGMAMNQGPVMQQQTFQYEPMVVPAQPQIMQSSSGYLQQQPSNITIINNKHELISMLEQAKEYELSMMRLQNEINEYRSKLLKENQQQLAVNIAQKEEFRTKLKKRDSKIEKLKIQKKQLAQDNTSLRLRIDDLQSKLYNQRLEYESKVQEKAFKVLMIKNQLKQIAQMPQFQTPQQQQSYPVSQQNATGIATPGASIANQSLQRVYSQNELYTMINNIIQNQLNSGTHAAQNLSISTTNEPQQFKQRPKSQEHTSRRKEHISQRFYDQPMLSPVNLFAQQEEDSLNNKKKLELEDSQQLVIPNYHHERDLSTGRYTNQNKQRDFDNTMAFPPGKMMSPPLASPLSVVPRSVPRSLNYEHYQNIESAKHQNFKERIASQEFYKEKLPVQEFHYQDDHNTKDYQLINQHGARNEISYHPVHQTNTFLNNHETPNTQKEQMRDKIQRKASKIQQSRNKDSYKQNNNLINLDGQMKSTLSEGDFMNSKRKDRNYLEPNHNTLQKVCTTEISMIVDEQIEDSRRRRTENELSQQVQRSGELYNYSQSGIVNPPSLNVDHIQSRRGSSSYHSATFRRMSTQQQNSPQKNLQSHFEMVRDSSPVFYEQHCGSQEQYPRIDYNQFQSSIKDISPQKHSYSIERSLEHMNKEDLSRRAYHESVVQNQMQPYFEIQRISEDNVEEQNESPCKTVIDQSYLKNLKIRERQSRTRKHQHSSSAQKYQYESIADSINFNEKQQEEKIVNILFVPAMPSVSIVSDDYGTGSGGGGTFQNQPSSMQSQYSPKKPPLPFVVGSSGHQTKQQEIRAILPKDQKKFKPKNEQNCQESVASTKQKSSKQRQQHSSMPFEMKTQANNSENGSKQMNFEILQSSLGLPKPKPIDKNTKTNKLVHSSSAQGLIDQGYQSSSNQSQFNRDQKLEDIKRKYGRIAV